MTTRQALDALRRIAAYRLKESGSQGRNGWENACFYLGLMAAYRVDPNRAYLASALAWGRQYGFMPDHAGEADYARDVLVDHFTVHGALPWRYADDLDYLNIHADFICCGATYLALKKLLPNEDVDLLPVQRVLDFNVRDPHDDCWWWADAVHMALAVYHGYTLYTGSPAYAEKGHRLYCHTKKVLYNQEKCLWYRDWEFRPDRQTDELGHDIFWSRGNGWVYAGLADTLSLLPKDGMYYAAYKRDFLEMTPAILRCVCGDGFWHTSLLSPTLYDCPETSGTLMFLYGLARGYRLGILGEEVLPAFARSFQAFCTTALSEEGRVLYVQGVADRPGPVDKDNTRAYASGYALKVFAEVVSLLEEGVKLS